VNEECYGEGRLVGNVDSGAEDTPSRTEGQKKNGSLKKRHACRGWLHPSVIAGSAPEVRDKEGAMRAAPRAVEGGK
jgi:hypothetical protein